MGQYRIALFSSAAPERIARLIRKIRAEAPDILIGAVLVERRPPKPVAARIRGVLKRLRNTSYCVYLLTRVRREVGRHLAKAGYAALRFAHACPSTVVQHPTYTDSDLRCDLEGANVPLYVTEDVHSAASLEFVRAQHPNLGVIYGTRILKPELFTIPRDGSINIHKRKVPEYRGGGPIGLWELLAGEQEIGITVHRVVAAVDAGAVLKTAAIPIEPYDTLDTLQLKAGVVGDELLVGTIRDLARGKSEETPQPAGGRVYKSPSPAEMISYEKEIARRRPRFRVSRGRPAWKLLLRSTVTLPLILTRNWYRRLRGRFPVIVLFHHVITDRAHYMGLPTEMFLRHVDFLQSCYRLTSLAEALDELKSGRVTAPTVVITFDDGYKDNCLNLRAVAEAAKCPATLFVCADYVGSDRLFDHDVRRGSGGFLPLSWEDVEKLSRAGFTFGSHTCSHFDCSSDDRKLLEYEIAGSRSKLEEHLGHVPWFAFPWGTPEKISSSALQMAASVYENVFAACGGLNKPAPRGSSWLHMRCGHPNDLWELELALQGVLEVGNGSTAVRKIESLSRSCNVRAQSVAVATRLQA